MDRPHGRQGFPQARTTRRTFLGRTACLLPTAAGLVGCRDRRETATEEATAVAVLPATLGWFMPAEWRPHERCWMAWPTRQELWYGLLDAARGEYAEVARTIARFEPVTMVARPDQADQARKQCGDGVTVLPLPIDDSWTRDTGPAFLIDGKGGLAGAAWRFNAWGGKFQTFADDARLGRRILDEVGVDCFASPLVTEGGAFHVDGEGTVLTTESAVLNANRNPGMSKADAEAALCGWLGAKKVVWLPGSKADRWTDGHIDTLAVFACPGLVVAESTADPTDPQHGELRENVRALKAAVDARGRRIEVVLIERPTGLGKLSEAFCRSYVNFYRANGAVILAKFGDKRADDAARDVVARIFPGQSVVQVGLKAIPESVGGIHCITQQQPICGKRAGMAHGARASVA